MFERNDASTGCTLIEIPNTSYNDIENPIGFKTGSGSTSGKRHIA